MGILSLMMPALNSVFNAAHKTECKNNMRTFSTSEQLHTEDFDGFFAPLFHINSSNRVKSWQFNTQFQSYFPGEISPTCPTYSQLGSYGLNMSYGRFRSHIDKALSIQTFDNPSEKLQGSDASSLIFGTRSPGSASGWDELTENAFRSVSYRHRSSALAFYFDGHVSESLEKVDFYNDSLRTQKIKYNRNLLHDFKYTD